MSLVVIKLVALVLFGYSVLSIIALPQMIDGGYYPSDLHVGWTLGISIALLLASAGLFRMRRWAIYLLGIIIISGLAVGLSIGSISSPQKLIVSVSVPLIPFLLGLLFRKSFK